MYPGNYCRSCERLYLCDYNYKDSVAECVNYKPKTDIIITNADKIRSLKDSEDLAEAIIFAYKKGRDNIDWKTGIVNWLTDRVEED